MNIRMIGNRVLVRPDGPETKIGNVYLPDSAQSKSRRGTVLAVGPGKPKDDGTYTQCEAKPGDVVLLREFSGQEVKVGDEMLYIVFDHEILAVVEPDQPHLFGFPVVPSTEVPSLKDGDVIIQRPTAELEWQLEPRRR